MAFYPTTTEETLENLQQNLVMPFHTVHDEIDIIIPNHIAEGVTQRIAYIAACKDVMDKIGSGYVNYLADCEMDRKNFSWIPRQQDSLNPYTMPHSRHEKQAKDAMDNAHITPKIVDITTDLSIADFRSKIKYDPNGVFVNLKTPTKTVLSTRPISIESLKPFIKDNTAL